MQAILNECSRPTFAEKATYAYARGGSNIKGPSINLAKAIARAWTHIKFGSHMLSQNQKQTEVEAYAWDFETMNMTSRVIFVSHIRHTRNGDTLLTDPRDISEMVENQVARKMRNCILDLVPADVVESALNAVDTTLRVNLQLTPEKIANMQKLFDDKYGVTRKHLEKYIQRSIEKIEPTQYLRLSEIYNSLKDDMSTPTDWFDMSTDKPANAADPKVDKLKAKLTENPATVPEPSPAPLTQDEARNLGI
jgi:hypothetical protein